MPKPFLSRASDDPHGEPAEPAHLWLPPELNREGWRRAGRRLLAKMLAEFAYEEIIQPVPVPTLPEEDTGRGQEGPASEEFLLPLDAEGPADGRTLRFRARRGAYGSWRVDEQSIRWDGPTRTLRPISADRGGATVATLPEGAGTAAPDTPEDDPADPLEFLLRARRLLDLDGATLGHLVRELSATLSADTRLDHTARTASELADLGYAELEGHQTGHPWIVTNKGRLGFAASDLRDWAPEARRARPLPWIAVRAELAVFRGTAGVGTPDRLYERELDPDVRATFATFLQARGLEPDDYLCLPVHPWQWDEIVVPLFASSIAAEDIVPLPPADRDLRLPQQSIRTFLNVTRPDRHSVKLPLSILNTLVWRGLPTERTVAAPAVTAWIHQLRDADPFLRDDCQVILLGEVASVAVRHRVYERLHDAPYQYQELLGAIWREPLAGQLAPWERGRTLAALLHTDPSGRALVAELVERSGVPPRIWLRSLFAALLPPLLHFLYRYGTVFSPHGENAIVVFDDHDVPVRLAVKDFVDDVNISAHALPEHADMPPEVRDVLLTEPPAFLTQFLHSGLFIGVFRHLATLCEEHLCFPEAEFWTLVRVEIRRHQERFPELKERFEIFDLLTPRIERLCLNRNRLYLDGYRDRSSRPHAAVHGTVPNPLHSP